MSYLRSLIDKQKQITIDIRQHLSLKRDLYHIPYEVLDYILTFVQFNVKKITDLYYKHKWLNKIHNFKCVKVICRTKHIPTYLNFHELSLYNNKDSTFPKNIYINMVEIKRKHILEIPILKNSDIYDMLPPIDTKLTLYYKSRTLIKLRHKGIIYKSTGIVPPKIPLHGLVIHGNNSISKIPNKIHISGAVFTSGKYDHNVHEYKIYKLVSFNRF